MRTRILIFTLLLVSAMTSAETMRVAILETVDRENKVSYGTKLILRSNLSKAVTNTAGYEAYDRTDMDAIMGEQDFQRTGMVSNDQIKRLGEMTGAKYVLVAEAAVVDAHNMYITAKLLDVETARTVMTDNQLMGATAKEIQRGCQLLADKLIKPAVTTTASNVKPAKQEKPAPAKQEQPKQEQSVSAPQPAPAPMQYQQPVVYNNPTQSNSMITKISNNEYRMNGNVMDRKAYEKFIYQNCPEAWKKYKNGKTAVATGWSVLGAGTALAIVGGVVTGFATNPNSGTFAFGISGISIGSAGWIAGLISFSVGYSMKANSLKVYNEQCATKKTLISIGLQSNSNEIGFALKF